MRFEWDEQKNQNNIRKHGFDFADAWKIFAGPMLVDVDDREEYGETRWIGIGMIEMRVVVVVYVEINAETTRVISLRKALDYERKAYEASIQN
jgi:uncharacterized DUF497 family protein